MSEQNSTPIVVESVPSIESIWQEWSMLAERAGNIFLTPEWASIWWNHFGNRHQLRLSVCRNAEGRLIAIIPLYYWRRQPLRVLRFLGHGPGDALGPVYAAGDCLLATTALARALERERFDVLLGDLLPGIGAWSSRLRGSRALGQYGNPTLSLTRSNCEQLVGSKGWKRIRQRETQLARSHSLRYRQGGDTSCLDGDLDILFRLHAERWGARDSNFVGSDNAFHREFAALAQARGWLRMWFLELDGQPVGAWFGFRFSDAEYYYQGGRDPAYEKLSIGTLLTFNAIRSAFEDGAHEYRFLRGGESYKYRFASSDTGLETIALAGTQRGRIAVSSATGLLALRRAIRRLHVR